MSAYHEVSEEKMKEAFEKVDVDNDGVIDREQFVEAMKVLGEDLNEQEVIELIKRAPVKDSFDFSDFIDMVTFKLSENTEETIAEALQELDRHNEGFLTEENFRRIMTTSGERLSEEEFKQMMSFVKLDRDRNFSYQELLANIAEKNPGIAFQKLT